MPRYVGTCKIRYEKILDTIHKSGLYDFIQVAYSQPLFCRSAGKIYIVFFEPVIITHFAFFTIYYHTYTSLVVNIPHILSHSCLCITLNALFNLFLFWCSPEPEFGDFVCFHLGPPTWCLSHLLLLSTS